MAPRCNIITLLFLPAVPQPGALVYEITPLSVIGTVAIHLRAVAVAGGVAGGGEEDTRERIIKGKVEK